MRQFISWSGISAIVCCTIALSVMTVNEGKAMGRSGSQGILWTIVKGGLFMMGSPDGKDSEPIHRVMVGTFMMARSEVTVGQYRKCVKAGACAEPATGKYCNWGKSDRDDHPVNCVDWHQAVAFSNWVGGRLPTEAEWEYAARSGGLYGRYPWDGEVATCVRAVMNNRVRRSSITHETRGCGENRTWPVCSKPAGNSVQGLCDMVGNVWEWVQDGYHDTYRGASPDGSAREAKAGKPRVVRGGSWSNGAFKVQSTIRSHMEPGRRLSTVGFRPVRPAPPPGQDESD